MECIIDGMLRNGARRAIIPGVGAFIRKESGEVIFSDLLRCDDGAMAAYLVEHEGITPAMAQERTRAYAGRVQAELTRSGHVEFPGWGILSRTEQGHYHFVPANRQEPAAAPCDHCRPAVEEQAAAPHAEPADTVATPSPEVEERSRTGLAESPAAEPARPVASVREETAPAATPSVEEVAAAHPVAEPEPVAEPTDGPIQAETAPASESAPAPVAATSDASAAAVGSGREGMPARRTGQQRLRNVLFDEEETSGEAQPATAATATGGSQAGPQTDRAEEPAPYRPEIHIRRPNRPRKRMDGVLVIAVIALVITLGVLVYGYFAKRDIAAMHEQELVLEMTADPGAEEAAE